MRRKEQVFGKPPRGKGGAMGKNGSNIPPVGMQICGGGRQPGEGKKGQQSKKSH